MHNVLELVPQRIIRADRVPKELWQILVQEKVLLLLTRGAIRDNGRGVLTVNFALDRVADGLPLLHGKRARCARTAQHFQEFRGRALADVDAVELLHNAA